MAIDLDAAVKAHIDWLGRLMQALQRNSAPADLRVETDGDCLFSRWMAEQTTQFDRDDDDTMRRIDACHLAMHRQASALLQMPNSDEAYYASLDEFCRTAIEFNRLVVGHASAAEPLCCSA